MSTDLHIEVSIRHQPTVKLSGQVDFHNRHLMCQAFESFFEQNVFSVAADLSELHYIDSSGISGLIKCALRAIDQGGSIELIGSTPQLNRVLTICGGAAFFKSNLPDLHSAPRSSSDQKSPSFWHVCEFNLDATPESAAVARGRISEVLDSLPMTTDAKADSLVAFGEAFVNAIRHGCGQSSSLKVYVKCIAEPSRLSIEVADPGPGFHPDIVPIPTPQTLQQGGMGIYLMRELMDEVEFSFNGRTTARLVKHISPQTDTNSQDTCLLTLDDTASE